jgi:hypothetical protein
MTDRITEDTLQKRVPPVEEKKEEVTPREVKKMAAIAASPAPTASQASDLLSWKKRETGKMLAAEPKVRIKIPFNVGEDKNAQGNQYAFFGINGFTVLVKKDEYVDVPQSIANLLESGQTIEKENEKFLLSNIGMKIDPETHQPKSIGAFGQHIDN